MDTKSLSFRQVRWAQELSWYHFQINYCQGKANAAADALSRFPQRSQDEEEKLQAENGQILYCLQNSLTSASLASLSSRPSHLHQVLICRTYVLSQLREFLGSLQSKLLDEGFYTASIDGMRLRLYKLQVEDDHACKLRAEQLVKDWQDIDNMLHHQSLSYISQIIQTKFISRHYDNPLVGHFRIEKTQKLFSQKYYWPTLRRDVNNYVRGCDVCLALKAIRNKPYGDLQSLPTFTHHWKDLSMDFVIGLPISTDWKGDSYDSIFVINDWLTKMVHYKPVKVTINASGLAEVIINVIVRHHGLPDSIVTDWGSFFTSKFWSLLCYFLGIKRRLSTDFHPQTNSQIERQNSTMEAYLWAFVNFEQNDWARLLPMPESAYNNAKNANIGFTSFELNCRYHLRVFYKEDLDPRSKSRTAEELSSKLRELMTVCQQNLHHAQELQKRAHDKGVKPQSYAPGDKVWLSSKHLKTKRNRKLEAKFLGPFRVLHPVSKQAYKLELPKKWRIHNVFHISLLEQDTTKKRQVNDMQLDFEFEASDDKKYEIDGIWDSTVDAKESATKQLPGFYYLVLWKGYPEEKNTWEPTLAIQHLWRLVTTYHKDNPKKPTTTFLPVDTAPPMTRPMQGQPAGPTTAPTKKRGRPAGFTTTNKWEKKS